MKKITSLLMILFTILGFSQDPTGKIQNYLNANSAKLNLTREDVNDWFIESTGNSKSTKIDTYYIKQRYQGIEIYNAVSTVWVKNDEVINIVNGFIPNVSSKINSTRTSLNVMDALQKGFISVNSSDINAQVIETISDKSCVLSNGNLTEDPITAKLEFQPLNGSLRLAWDFTFYSQDYNHLWSIRVDAVNGNILEKNDLTVSCRFENASSTSSSDFSFYRNMFKDETTSSLLQVQGGSYRVVPFNYESPNHHTRDLIASPEDATASPKGWHDTNASGSSSSVNKYTYLRGNNVWARSDYSGSNPTSPNTSATSDGYSPTSSSLVFDYTYPGTSVAANTYINAATTNLFYTNNILHDIWYQYGFDEPNGNFQQTNNVGGGAGSDYVYADAQDSSTAATPQYDNANFTAPVDGSKGRMQMYLWDKRPLYQLLTINSPSDIAGPVYTADNAFDPGHVAVPVTPDKAETDIILFDDGTPDVGQTDNADACSPAINAAAINGHIVIIRRSTSEANGGTPCAFVDKVKNAQDAGAIAVIIVNNDPSNPYQLISMAGADASITIPAISVTQIEGEAIISKILSNVTVNGKIQSDTQLGLFVNTDGDLDNGVIEHEFGHGISIRLTGGRTNSACLQNPEQMGEGWSDWFALMLTMHPGDVGTTPRGIATFCNGQTTSGGGIRYYPYSTDMNVNPETFGYTNGTVFPTTAINSSGVEYVEPHAVGEMWTTVLWDLAWAYVGKYGYDDNKYTGTGGNNKVMQLVIDAIKLQPCSPSFIDARDAIIAADQETTGGQDYCMIWEVFAKRGYGVNASSGDSSGTNLDIAAIHDQIEDFTLPTLGTTPDTGSNCNFGVDYFENTELFRVYPNPTNGYLNVRINNYVGKVTMQVVDINGRIVNEYNNEDFNIEKSLDLNHLQTGVYVLKVSGDSLNFTQKIIKN